MKNELALLYIMNSNLISLHLLTPTLTHTYHRNRNSAAPAQPISLTYQQTDIDGNSRTKHTAKQPSVSH